MSTKLSKSVLSKLLVCGVVMGACVGGTALPASAALVDDGDVHATDYGPVRTTLNVSRHIELGRGEVIENHGTSFFEVHEDAKGKPEGFSVAWPSGVYGPVSAMVAYPLDIDGEATNYWLSTQISLDRPGSRAQCEVFLGKPALGAEATQSAPVDCEISKPFFSSSYKLTVGLRGFIAESSGKITAAWNVALTNGTYRTDSSYHHAGAAQLAGSKSSRFDAVLRTSDTPFHENQARTEWAYQIVDGDTVTRFWVAGLSTNYRGWSKFSADARCAIYDSNPLEGKGSIDGQRPIGYSPYKCYAAGEVVHGPTEDDNRHFDASFSVRKK